MHPEPETKLVLTFFYLVSTLVWGILLFLFSALLGWFPENYVIVASIDILCVSLGLVYVFFMWKSNHWYFSHGRLEKVTYWLEETPYIWILLAILVLYLPLFVYISLWFVYMLLSEWFLDWWYFLTEKRGP